MSKRVLLFLSNGFEALEASVFTDICGWSTTYGNQPVELITAGLHKNVTATWNFNVAPEVDLMEINPADYDALAIAGGFEKAGFYTDAYDERFLDVIRVFDQHKKYIAAICVAALPLGKAGILKNRPATTYGLPNGERQDQLQAFGAVLQLAPLVVHENIITSSGPNTAVDVAFKLLELLTDKANVDKVKYYMGFC